MQAREGLKGSRNNWQGNNIPSITNNPKVQQAGTAVTPHVLPRPFLQSCPQLWAPQHWKDMELLE